MPLGQMGNPSYSRPYGSIWGDTKALASDRRSAVDW
jgi:hypothetical protein